MDAAALPPTARATAVSLAPKCDLNALAERLEREAEQMDRPRLQAERAIILGEGAVSLLARRAAAKIERRALQTRTVPSVLPPVPIVPPRH